MLTKAGWPRPQYGGWPIPWVSPAENLSTMDNARAAACASGAICGVCGEGYGDDDPAVAFVNAREVPEPLASVDIQPMDNGVLHKRCAQLALAMCPKLKELFSAGELQIVSTKGNVAQVVIADGKPLGRIDGADCTVISKASLKEL